MDGGCGYMLFFFSVLFANCWDYKLFQLGSKRRINTQQHCIRSTCDRQKNIKHHTNQGLISFMRCDTCDAHTELSKRFSPASSRPNLIPLFSVEWKLHSNVWISRIMDVLKSLNSFMSCETCSKHRESEKNAHKYHVENSHVILYSSDEHSSTLNRCFSKQTCAHESGRRS